MNFKYYLLLLLSTTVLAQKVKTSIDTTKNKIGAQFTLTLKAIVKEKSTVSFPEPKNMGSLEVIESYPVDTIREKGRFELIKKYGLTQFDSGAYIIPRIPIAIDEKIISSDSIRVEVFNVPVDTLKQKMYDIKPIILVKKPFRDWMVYVLIAFILFIIIGLAIYFWLKHKVVPEKLIEYSSPIEKATNLLQSLENKDLVEKGEIKEYYSELTDIVRDYIEEAIKVPAKESTTSELIEALKMAAAKKKMNLSKETLVALEKVLKQADLVKFAKSKPENFEIVTDKQIISETIKTIDSSIPEEIDEESLKWELLQQELRIKKRKRNRKIISSSVIVFLITAFVVYTITKKGLDYIMNGFSGYSTTELLAGNWVKSEYGLPGVIIETPEVLTRVDVEKAIPKETMALIKDMQMFGFGSLDSFNIMVSTIQYKKETKIDLSQAYQENVNLMEAQGCKDVFRKQEEFTTEKGIKGYRGFGSYLYENKKMYYQILLFSQEGGLQQVFIAHKDGNENALKIAERMLNSVELKLVN